MKSKFNRCRKSTLVCIAALLFAGIAYRCRASEYDSLRNLSADWRFPEDSTASNVYWQVRSIYAPSDDSRFVDCFVKARNHGVESAFDERQMREFAGLCSFVSNHCEEVAIKWRRFEDNEMVRFTVLSAAAFCGFETMTNFSATILADLSGDSGSCSWDTAKFLRNPRSTPLERYMTLNYDIPAISNMLNIVKVQATENGDADIGAFCDADLSGRAKAEYEAMKAAGAL